MEIIYPGLTDFSEVYEVQKKIVSEVSSGRSENTLIITEHLPVITIGRKGLRRNILVSDEFLAKKGIKVVSIDRGGDVTYHGPGQIVAYPVFRLENESRDIYRFLEYLERVGIDFLKKYGIFPRIKESFRGLWFDDKKLASIGIGVKKWTTYHGISINIKKDIAPFSYIRPCGIEGVRMVSVEEINGYEVDVDGAKCELGKSFRDVPFLAEEISKGR